MANPIGIVTGASRGIGLATALRLARAGYSLVVAARGAEALDRAARQIGALGVEVQALPVDVGSEDGARKLVEVALRRFKRIDVLVNNAGVAPVAKVTDFQNADFERAIATNISAVFYTTRAVWPVMTNQAGGVIVNVSSVASLDPFPGLSVYGGCKAWVNTFTKAMAEEGKAAGIRVFAVAPGAVDTPMLRSAFPDYPRDAALTPDQVAAVIETCCDPRLAPASGETIVLRR